MDGIRVLDLTTSVAGPYATMLLSDFGAEVIKFERPAGDDARHWGPPFLEDEGLWFVAMNRNKKSVVLDVTQPDGMAALMGLASTADVVVTNQPASVQAKLGLRYEDFAARFVRSGFPSRPNPDPHGRSDKRIRRHHRLRSNPS